MEFWLDEIIRKSGIPYPLFFGLMALLLYLLGIPFMIATNNLQFFISDPMWGVVAIFGALNGILVVFVFRKFSDAISGIEHLMSSDDDHKISDRLLGYLNNKVYWIVVFFWLALNFIESPRLMRWWWFYNNPHLITIYELIETLPCCIIGGIFMYMIPVGLTLAYRDLCMKVPIRKDALVSEWMNPFEDFRNLITLTMFGAAIYAVFPPSIWGSTGPTSIIYWSVFVPYTGTAIVLIAAILLPHYYFHRFFANIKKTVLYDLGKELQKYSMKDDVNINKRILILLEKGEADRLKTWLVDVKTIGEILVVAVMHVLVVEALTALIHFS